MTDIKLITPAQERSLSSALVSAIRGVSSGMTPNESLAKSANDHGLTPEFACRMVEAYNASKTVSHLQATQGEKRAEDFELADRDSVLKLMYAPAAEPTVTTKASSFKPGTFVSYKKASVDLEKEAKDPMGVKNKPVALKEIRPLKSSGGLPKSHKKKIGLKTTKIAQLMGLQDKFKKIGEEIRMEARHARDQIFKAACELESALRVPGHEPFEEIEKRVICTYGEKLGKKAMDIVWSMSDFERMGEKRASAHPGRLLVLGAGPAYDAVRDMMSWLDKAARVDEEMKDWVDKEKQIEKILPEQSGQAVGGTGATFVSDPGMPRRPATAPLVDVSTAIKEPKKKKKTHLFGGSTSDSSDGDSDTSEGDSEVGSKAAEAADLGALDPTGMVSAFAGKPAGPKSIIDPEHESKIRTIKTRLMLNDMVSNDPVLSAYPPEKVYNAYNELSSIAPGVSNEPIVLRSLIGRSLQTSGRMDPSEIKQLLEAESVHRGIRAKGI